MLGRRRLGTTVRWSGWRRTVLLAVSIAALGTAACGDDSAGDDGSAGPSTTAAPTTTTTQPPATDTEEALAVVQDIADQMTVVLEEINKNPTVVDNPDDETLQQFKDLFTEDAEPVETVIDGLADFAESGHISLAGPSGVFADYYLFNPEADGDDTLDFLFCMLSDTERHDTQEGRLAGSTTIAAGQGKAHRVDGFWRLHEFNLSVEPTERDPSTVGHGTCKSETEMVADMLGDATGAEE